MKKLLTVVTGAGFLLAYSAVLYAQKVENVEGTENVQVANWQTVVFQNIREHSNPIIAQTETPIIVHPLNNHIMLAGSNAIPLAHNFVSLGWYYTTNGGSSWVGGDTLPTHSDLTKWMFDPSVAIDLNGNLFVSGVYTTPSFSVRNMVVAKSSDNGSHWSQTTIPKTASADKEDKDHMIVDVNSGSPYKNNLYITFLYYTTSPWPTMFCRSSDGGASFSTPVSISGSVTGTKGSVGVMLAVGPFGELYAIWGAFDNLGTAVLPVHLGFSKSTDGGASWDAAKSIRSYNYAFNSYLNKGGHCILDASPISMGVDRSGGPRQGWIYIVYPELTPKPNVFLIRSSDGGALWSNPNKVNQDTTSNDHWHPWLSVDPSTGFIYVVYYDSRNFPANDSAQVYVSMSTDGGETFKDILVSDQPVLPAPLGFPGGASCYAGDYIGISALNGVVWPSWADNRTGIYQAYTSSMVMTSVREARSGVPSSFALQQNYPNPFNPSSKIEFRIAKVSWVTLKVYDILGREVATLVNERKTPGRYAVKFDGSGLASGVYFYRLEAGSFTQTKKLLLLR